MLPKFSESFRKPADPSLLNEPFTTGDLNAKLDIFSSRHVCAAAFTNSSDQIQYLYGPHPATTPNGTELDRVVGSLYNRSDVLSGLGRIGNQALSFSCALVRSSIHTNSTFHRGTPLLTAHLVGTSYETQALTDLIIISVPSIFMMGMHDALPSGGFRDTAVADAFKGNGSKHENWIESITKAYNNAPDIAIIFAHLATAADKETHISPFYTDDLYPARAPSLNITIINRSTSTAPDFYAVSTILGVPAGPLGGVPVTVPAPTTVYIQKKDKALTESTAKILTRQRALFLTADIDWTTCSITNAGPPVFTPAFSNALAKKSIDAKARTLIGLWNDVVTPPDLDINDTT